MQKNSLLFMKSLYDSHQRKEKVERVGDMMTKLTGFSKWFVGGKASANAQEMAKVRRRRRRRKRRMGRRHLFLTVQSWKFYEDSLKKNGFKRLPGQKAETKLNTNTNKVAEMFALTENKTTRFH